jgi:CRISPR-associated protein Cas1
MQRIYIDKVNTQLKVDRNRLIIVGDAGVRPQSCPLRQIDSIVIHRKTLIDTSAMLNLSRLGVNLLCINSRDSSNSVACYSQNHGNYSRVFKQLTLMQQSHHRVEFAQFICLAKLKRQGLVLRQMLSKRGYSDMKVSMSIGRLKKQQDTLHHLPSTKAINWIRGHEGAAAREYFSALTRLFPAKLHFDGRNKRPPRDPVNALLSLGYTLIQNEAVIALFSAGLDARFGALHKPAYNRYSLACDMVELFRASYDYQVWRWCAEQTFCQHHFVIDHGACLLSKTARPEFYRRYESFGKKLRRKMRIVAQHWANNVDNQIVDELY